MNWIRDIVGRWFMNWVNIFYFDHSKYKTIRNSGLAICEHDARFTSTAVFFNISIEYKFFSKKINGRLKYFSTNINHTFFV